MYEKFSFKSVDELSAEIARLGVDLGVSDDMSVFSSPTKTAGLTIPNRLVVHPMEGCDGEADGSPSPLTIRRYERFARGGAGLIWFEAVAVVPEGRANPRQLWIHEGNWESYKILRENIDKWAKEEYGQDFSPVVIMQLTHSGRFSRPVDKPQPVIAYHNPYLNERMKLDEDYPVITDDELKALEEDFEKAAALAKKAGFDGVELKACHRYLVSELFSAYTRDGIYGGDFEGRTRFYINVIDRLNKLADEKFVIGSRLNMFDGIPRPYGWGVDENDHTKTDFEEPLKLIEIIREKGVKLLNVTMGTPYYNPHINRPYDVGEYKSDENQLESIARLISGPAEIMKRWDDINVVSTGYSWLRHLAPYVGAWVLKERKATLVGMGRMSFAYPSFARDILKGKGLDEKKTCIACGKCTELMRADSVTGCVIKDSKVYVPIYKEKVGGK